MYIRFSDALKAFRRNAHVYQNNWQCVIVCASTSMMEVAFRETVDTMQGTSHAKGMKIEHAKRRIECSNGAVIRFCVANSIEDVGMRLQGLTFTQLVIIGGLPEHKLANYVLPRMRSNFVPPEDYRTDLVEGI